MWDRGLTLGKGSTAALLGVAALLIPATANAAERHAAATGGSGTACTALAPCTIVTAVNQALAGDEVIVGPGTHAVGSTNLGAVADVDVHGAAGQPRPTISTSAATGLAVVDGTAANLRIDHAGGVTALLVEGAGAIGHELEVRSTGDEACVVEDGALLRDSTCLNVAAAPGGIALSSETSGPTDTAFVRNVTAVATGAGSFGVRAESTANAAMDLRNVIASGTGNDVVATASAPVTIVDVDLAHSNYDTTDETGVGLASVTPPGSATNQTAPPLFVGAASGDLRQAAGSPTIDAGAPDAKTGTQDFEGQPRLQGLGLDIGADEFVPQVAAADTTPPQTTIEKGPKQKTKSTKATFVFSADEAGSTFACKLDAKAFGPCSSPQRYKRLKKGKHIFSVVATDAAGNADATPATYRWKVKRKRKAG